MEENLKIIEAVRQYIKANGADLQSLSDLLDLVRASLKEAKTRKQVNELLLQTKFIKIESIKLDMIYNDIQYYNLYYKALLEETPYSFESYIEYLEKNRPRDKKFYEPRKKTLKVVVDDLQGLSQRKYKLYGLSMPSRTGKSTICIFFLSWIMCKRPNSHSAMGGHSGILAKGFYKEVMNIIDTEEYCFRELYDHMYPDAKAMIREKSAEEYTITLDRPDRFATLTCRGIDGTWTGAVDVSWDGILYDDDLVRDREHSLSPTRMENTFQEYLNKMVDRKSGFYPTPESYGRYDFPDDGEGVDFAGACELMVGTLWNVYDPLERLRKMYDGNPLYKFRRIPALNDDDESNFDYEVNGFSTEYYREMRQRLDKAEWEAKYQQRPFVREGILLPLDELKYFNGILPEGDHRIVAVVDVAWGGGDSLSMPIGAQYDNGDIYVFAWVFNKGAKEVTIPLVVGRIIENEIREIRFEGNTGGDLYCQYVDERLRQNGYKCSCSSKKAPTRMAKMEKIVAYSGDIKDHFYFLQAKMPTPEELEQDKVLGIKRYVRDKEYQDAMNEVGIFVVIGDNEHDDAVDGLTQLEMFAEGNSLAKIEIPRNPFGGIWGYK